MPEGDEQALERIWVIVPGRPTASLRRRRPGTALRESGRRGQLEPRSRALGPSDAQGLGAPAPAASASTRRALARRPVEAARRDLGRRCLLWTTAARRGGIRTRASCRSTCPRTRATTRSNTASTTSAASPRAPSGSSWSSTAACTAPTTRGDLDRRRRGPAAPTSASRSSSTRRSRQRLRDSADRRGGSDDAGGQRAGLGDPRRGAAPGVRAATACRPQDAYLTVLREAFDSRATRGDRWAATRAALDELARRCIGAAATGRSTVVSCRRRVAPMRRCGEARPGVVAPGTCPCRCTSRSASTGRRRLLGERVDGNPVPGFADETMSERRASALSCSSFAFPWVETRRRRRVDPDDGRVRRSPRGRAGRVVGNACARV